MTKTIEGVPEEITIAQLTELCSLLGLDTRDLIELHMTVGQVTATVIARDADGNRIMTGEGYAHHDIAIKIAR